MVWMIKKKLSILKFKNLYKTTSPPLNSQPSPLNIVHQPHDKNIFSSFLLSLELKYS